LRHPVQGGPKPDGAGIAHLATYPAFHPLHGQASRPDDGMPTPRVPVWVPINGVWNTNLTAALAFITTIATEIDSRKATLTTLKNLLRTGIDARITARAHLGERRLCQGPGRPERGDNGHRG